MEIEGTTVKHTCIIFTAFIRLSEGCGY